MTGEADVAQVPMDAFEEGTEIVRVYLAGALREARAVEETLSAAGVEFAVEVEELSSPNVLGLKRSRPAAGFWIRAGDLDRAIAALERGGHRSGLVRR
ncbi:MAG TPA: hypothetical protein VFL83_09455 [Anaeromyxobacter sp.]|nr:hypothetical protein [Anaeromyxobacter sp.]